MLDRLAAGTVDHFFTRHRRGDGSTFEVEISASVARVGDRELIYCLSRDVTERKRLESELVRALEEFQDLYDAVRLSLARRAGPLRPG